MRDFRLCSVVPSGLDVLSACTVGKPIPSSSYDWPTQAIAIAKLEHNPIQDENEATLKRPHRCIDAFDMESIIGQ